MKKYAHSREYGHRINPLSVSIAFVIALIWLVSEQNYYEDTYVAEKPTKPVVVKVAHIETMEEKIKRYFPRNGNTMIAVAHAESRMNMKAKGYNCYYYDGVATTTKIIGGSKACKVQDRAKAHSVDCFVLQKNYKGKECPKGMTVEKHLKEVSELSKVQGKEAWSSYNNKTYKKYEQHH